MSESIQECFVGFFDKQKPCNSNFVNFSLEFAVCSHWQREQTKYIQSSPYRVHAKYSHFLSVLLMDIVLPQCNAQKKWK